MDAEALRLIRLKLDAEKLASFGREQGLALFEMDNGYLIHCATRALFGEHAPQPFALMETRGRHLIVLGYGTKDGTDLAAHASAFAEPLVASVLVGDIEAKAMPTSWKPRLRVGFEVRVSPVVRLAKEVPGKGALGAEVDAFLPACWRAGDPSVPVDRQDVYRTWLAGQLERHGGARLVSMRMESFRRGRFTRRNHPGGPAKRTAHLVERPDALVQGVLEVTDSNAFSALLLRGVGRHRSFGFGMLLLRPA
jgi:CRISPR system Cascade subunit CasE